MNIIFKGMIASFLALIPCLTCFAHHGSHANPAGLSGPSLIGQMRSLGKPKNQFFLSYEFTQLDESLGQLHTTTTGGQWAFTPKWAGTLAVPVLGIAHNFRNDVFGVGDVSAGITHVFFETQNSYGVLDTQWGLPTGKESNGLGRGAVSQSSIVYLTHTLARWGVFFGQGLNFGYESRWEPVVLNQLGLQTPSFFNQKINMTLSVLGQIYADSEVFEAGSAKLFLEDRITYTTRSGAHIHAPLQFSLAFKLSVVDTLERKSNITVSSTDSVLFNDILYGVALMMQQKF